MEAMSSSLEATSFARIVSKAATFDRFFSGASLVLERQLTFRRWPTSFTLARKFFLAKRSTMPAWAT